MNIKKWKNITRKHINQIINKYKKRYKNNLAIVAIIKNEAPYIREWIEYHKLVGVDKFYIYNNESTDNVEKVLNPYIKSGLVTYKDFPGIRMQCSAYQDAILKYRFQNKYMAFIDIDEFILPIEESESIFDITEDVLSRDKHAGGLGVQWCVYGSSGHKTKPSGLVIENYLLRAENNFKYNQYIKTIANPRTIKEFSDPHIPVYFKNYYSINCNNEKLNYSITGDTRCYERIRINHYFTKSYEEFIQKRARGRSTSKGMYDISEFTKQDKNEVYDTLILRYLAKLKENLKIETTQQN